MHGLRTAGDLGNLLKAKQLLQEEEVAERGAKSIKGSPGRTGSHWCLARGRDMGLETLLCLLKRRRALGKLKSIKTASPNQSDSNPDTSLLLESLTSVSYAPDPSSRGGESKEAELRRK